MELNVIKYSKIFIDFWECRADFLMSHILGNRWPCVPESFSGLGLFEIIDAQGQVYCASIHLLFVYCLEEKTGVCLFFLQTMQGCLQVPYLIFSYFMEISRLYNHTLFFVYVLSS